MTRALPLSRRVAMTARLMATTSWELERRSSWARARNRTICSEIWVVKRSTWDARVSVLDMGSLGYLSGPAAEAGGMGLEFDGPEFGQIVNLLVLVRIR